MTTAVLTRPLADCQRLSKLLQDQGTPHITLPIMEVTPLPESQFSPLPSISPNTIVIFVSANAVRWGLPEMKVALDQVDSCQVIAVGQKTRDTLVTSGIEAQVPERADSEGLLHMAATCWGKNSLQEVPGWSNGLATAVYGLTSLSVLWMPSRITRWCSKPAAASYSLGCRNCWLAPVKGTCSNQR